MWRVIQPNITNLFDDRPLVFGNQLLYEDLGRTIFSFQQTLGWFEVLDFCQSMNIRFLKLNDGVDEDSQFEK